MTSWKTQGVCSRMARVTKVFSKSTGAQETALAFLEVGAIACPSTLRVFYLTQSWELLGILSKPESLKILKVPSLF